MNTKINIFIFLPRLHFIVLSSADFFVFNRIMLLSGVFFFLAI